MTGTLLDVPIGDVHPAPDNPRTDLGDLSELAASIASIGIVEPLIVTGTGDGDHPWELVAGARRLAAAQQADLELVPVIVRELTDDERKTSMLVENLMRKDLSPLEEAAGYAQLRSLHIGQKTIAEKVGVAPSQVSRRIMLLSLPERAQQALETGDVQLRAAEELARLARRDKEAAAKVAAQPSSAWAWKAQQANQELDGAEWVAIRKAELEQAGLRTVIGEDTRGVRFLDVIAKAQPDPAAFVDEHASLACHAVELSGIGQTEYVVCTDPSSHDATATTEPDEEIGPSEWQLRKDASAAREPFYRALLDRQAHDDTRSLIIAGVAFFIDEDGWASEDKLHAWLGAEASDDQDDPLRDLAVKSDRDRFRIALARTLAGVDELLTTARDVPPIVLELHDKLLASVGYTSPEVAA